MSALEWQAGRKGRQGCALRQRPLGKVVFGAEGTKTFRYGVLTKGGSATLHSFRDDTH